MAGIEEASVGALVKLEQVLPSRLRHRVNAMQAAVVAVPGSGPTVDGEVLTAVATAIRAHERLRFDYSSRASQESVRTTEPHRLVTWGRRWYLVAWDNDREDWRTFRVDRMAPRTPTGPRFAPRELPFGDVADYVRSKVSTAVWHYSARIRVHASAEYVIARMPVPITPEPIDDGTCVITVGSDTPHQLALWIGMLDVDFVVLDAPELADALRRLGDRFYRAASS